MRNEVARELAQSKMAYYPAYQDRRPWASNSDMGLLLEEMRKMNEQNSRISKVVETVKRGAYIIIIVIIII